MHPRRSPAESAPEGPEPEMAEEEVVQEEGMSEPIQSPTPAAEAQQARKYCPDQHAGIEAESKPGTGIT
ncbi:MAG: hypothetical protein ABSF12_26515, partial [Bryobacteraceae bacterium]